MTLTLKSSRLSFRKACPGSGWPRQGQGRGDRCPRGGVEIGASLSQVAGPGLTPAPGMSPDPLLPTWLVHSGRALGQPGDGRVGLLDGPLLS